MPQTLYDYCIEKDDQVLLRRWHPTKNGELSPQNITLGSNRKLWWICEKGHEYQSYIKHHPTAKSACPSCPYCIGKKALVGSTDLATTHPELAAQWHPTKNWDKSPQMVVAGSNKKAWWICEKGHEWEARIGSRTTERKHGCPICTGRQVLPGYNDLASQRPDIAARWHPTKNGELGPKILHLGVIAKCGGFAKKGTNIRQL